MGQGRRGEGTQVADATAAIARPGAASAGPMRRRLKSSRHFDVLRELALFAADFHT